jgi:hypothetical protein
LITQELRAVLLRNRSLKPSIFTFLKYWVKLKTQLSFMIKLDFFFAFLRVWESFYWDLYTKNRLMKLRTEEKNLTVWITCLRLVNEAQSRNMLKQLHRQMEFISAFEKRMYITAPSAPILHFASQIYWTMRTFVSKMKKISMKETFNTGTFSFYVG